MSYPIAGNVKTFKAKEYNVDHPIVVCHWADVSNAKNEDAGLVLADTLRQFLYDLEVDDGLSAIGYTKEDIPALRFYQAQGPLTRFTNSPSAPSLHYGPD
ncbi:hypothetical protein JZ751_001016 [Albula glossodonta]|uniref:Uncharacterized protein n=1 Tax=Albula glossodonta TaxID=121402 RepID=A0A8T2PXA7_9TELE|nr:hypothetical protein JZ751_001016 [Albula glossodonta]